MSTQLGPLRRVGTVEHVGDSVAVLADDSVSGYTTGADLVMDGGALLQVGAEDTLEKVGSAPAAK